MPEAVTGVDATNHVYIRSDEFSWVPARVEKVEDGNAFLVVPQYKDERSIQSDGGRKAKRFEKQVISLAAYPNQALPLQNVDDKAVLKEVEDMVDLPYLHEAAIMYNLKARHLRGKPYTRTGDIVIACNPYKWMMELYSEKCRVNYANMLVWGTNETKDTADPRQLVEPHVYETSSLAYRGLACDGDDQSILVSGESGAGKTETVKILMNDLASVQSAHPALKGSAGGGTKENSCIVQRVLDSNPLLEAFGNAKTVRNDNSSRFGKYIQLQFDAEDVSQAAFRGSSVPSCVLAGSKCEVYLLEKSRVVSHEEEERSYHIFYQLLAAPEELKVQFWEGLEETDIESFSYVGWTETDTIEDETDEERFQHTLKSLALVGIADEKLHSLMRVICVVLQLGNLLFEPLDGDEDKSTISTKEELDDLAELMGVPPNDVVSALTLRTVVARGEEYKVPMNPEKAKESCDAFAKEIYAKTFLWIVRTINDATSAERNYVGDKKKGFGIIGLLDIFGFESFETNRFEQLCINYANEKLQQKFTQDIFRSVQAEYEFEGIELGEITYDDNTDVLDLVEGRMGLLAFLNEECVRPKGSDKAFVTKVHSMNKESSCWFREGGFHDTEFGIVHFAGKVVYDATNFVAKNNDNLATDMSECAKKSTNEILANELENEAMMNVAVVKKKRPKKEKKRPKMNKPRRGSMIQESVWSKFKNQLQSLMVNLGATRTRYIRCIKPNPFKEPLEMQHLSTIEQLRCAGVVAAVTISRSAFPNRLEHEIVVDRFRSLWKKGGYPKEEELDEMDMEMRSQFLCEKLLTSALEELQAERLAQDGYTVTLVKAFVIGKTRAYFRAGALEFLEAERIHKLGLWAKEIQKIVRGFVMRAKFGKFRRGIVLLQAKLRMRIARATFCKLRVTAIVVQCWIRCVNAARALVTRRRNYSATLIATQWRMAMAATNLKRNRGAAVVVQTMVRGALQRPKYRIALAEKKEEAKLENQLKALQRRLEEAENRRIEAEKLAEEKARKAVKEYQEKAEEEKKEAQQPIEPEVRVEEAPHPSTVKKKEGQPPKQDKENEQVDQNSQAKQVTQIDQVDQDDQDQQAEQSDDEPAVKNEAQAEAPAEEAPMAGQLSMQQQTLMDESGKMLEYLRKEVFKLRNQNAQLRTEYDLVKDNNKRLMDSSASAGASFTALNQHAKQLSKMNSKLTADIAAYRHRTQKLNVTNVELKEELKMKQATYIAEVHSRLQYQKALSRIVELVQERCRDTRLVEAILSVADECEAEYVSGPAVGSRPQTVAVGQPREDNNNDSVRSWYSFWG